MLAMMELLTHDAARPAGEGLFVLHHFWYDDGDDGYSGGDDDDQDHGFDVEVKEEDADAAAIRIIDDGGDESWDNCSTA
jgi:hypothetical protein